MSNPVYVATRKGLFAVDLLTNGTWAIKELGFLGSPVWIVLHDARHDVLFAALNHEHFGTKLHRSTDAGGAWEECAVPAYPKQSTGSTDLDNGAESAPSLHGIWSLETGGPDEPNTLWAGTAPGGLFRSRDRGSTWQFIDSLWNLPGRREWFGAGTDHPILHSVCVDPRNSQSLRIAVSCGGVYRSDDGGESWTCGSAGMRAEYMPPERAFDLHVQDAHRLVQCAADPDIMWVQHHNGVFRTTNNAQSWDEIENVSPSGFGFAAAVHPKDPDTAWFVPGVKDECRVPVDGRVVVTRTTNGGKSFEVLRNGLPQEHAYDIVFRHALDVDKTGQQLAMGSSTGSLWISEDSGDSWLTVSNHLPPVYCVRFVG